MDLVQAVEIFVQGFCRWKSRTYPYVATKVDGLWIMRDTPSRKNERKIEVVSVALSPETTVERIKQRGLGWHFLCVAHDREADLKAIRARYKQLGYRAMSTERFFCNDLREIPSFESNPPVREVCDELTLRSINQCAQQRRALMPGIRTYAIWDETRDYGWVHSVPYGNDAWVSDLYVYEEFRRRGYGRALMSRLLVDDRLHGFRSSVLLASNAGAKLYPELGYRQFGVLQVLCPLR